MRVFGQNINRLQHVQGQECIKICKTLLKKSSYLYTSVWIYGFFSESVLDMCAHEYFRIFTQYAKTYVNEVQNDKK